MPEHESLQGLYPFLHGGRQDAGKLDTALLESVRKRRRTSVETKRRFLRGERPRPWSRWRMRSQAFIGMTAGSSRWVTADRVAMPRISPSSFCTLSHGAAGTDRDQSCRGYGDDDSCRQRRRLLAYFRSATGCAGTPWRRADRRVDERQLRKPARRICQGRAMGLLTIGLSGHDGGRMAAAPISIIAWLCRAIASIAYRKRTSRFTTSYGTWCIRC